MKLKYLRAWTEARRRNVKRYRRYFDEVGLGQYVSLPEDTPGHIYNQFVVRCLSVTDYNSFCMNMGYNRVYYPDPLHLQECFHSLGYHQGSFPQAETAARQTLALPIYPELTESQQHHVVQCCQNFIAANRDLTSFQYLSFCYPH